MDWGRNAPDAMAGNENRIYFNSEWAAILVSEPEKSRDAFKLTMGHEMAHLNNQFNSNSKAHANDHFVKWVNEVHADFAGMNNFLDGDKLRCLEAMEFKLSRYRVTSKDSFAHPSWEKRKEYIANYDFDEKLIRRIAKDAMMTDESVIEKAIEFANARDF